MVLPMFRVAEEGSQASIEVAFGEEPGDVEPFRVAKLFQFFVVTGDVGSAIVFEGAVV